MLFLPRFLEEGAGVSPGKIAFGDRSLSSPCIHLLTLLSGSYADFWSRLRGGVERNNKVKHSTGQLLLAKWSWFHTSSLVFRSAATFHPTSLFCLYHPDIRQEAIRTNLCPQFLYLSPATSPCKPWVFVFRKCRWWHRIPTRPVYKLWAPWFLGCCRGLPQCLLGWLVFSFRSYSVFNDCCFLWKTFASIVVPHLILILSLHTPTWEFLTKTNCLGILVQFKCQIKDSKSLVGNRNIKEASLLFSQEPCRLGISHISSMKKLMSSQITCSGFTDKKC